MTTSEKKKKKKLMVALPMPQDTVMVELRPRDDDESVVDLLSEGSLSGRSQWPRLLPPVSKVTTLVF